MGRPKGSKNKKHKRKYTKRNGEVRVLKGHEAAQDRRNIDASLHLVDRVKFMINEAPPAVARPAIMMLSDELGAMRRLIAEFE